MVLIANIVSFGALTFPGHLTAGIPDGAIWSTLALQSHLAGVWVALSTSLPTARDRDPFPDRRRSRVVAAVSAVLPVVATGASSGRAAVQTATPFFTGATVMSGALLYGSRGLPMGITPSGSYPISSWAGSWLPRAGSSLQVVFG